MSVPYLRATERVAGKFFRFGPPSLKGPRGVIFGVAGDSLQIGLDRQNNFILLGLFSGLTMLLAALGHCAAIAYIAALRVSAGTRALPGQPPAPARRPRPAQGSPCTRQNSAATSAAASSHSQSRQTR